MQDPLASTSLTNHLKLQIVQDPALQVIPRDLIRNQTLQPRGDEVAAVGVVGVVGKKKLHLPLQMTGDILIPNWTLYLGGSTTCIVLLIK